jgi:hypothetical protein
MTVRPDSVLGRLARAARADMPVLRVSASRRIVQFLVAAGARPTPAGDSMTVEFHSGDEGKSAQAQQRAAEKGPVRPAGGGGSASPSSPSGRSGPPAETSQAGSSYHSWNCLTCGSRLYADDVFCGTCGSPAGRQALGVAASWPAAAAPVSAAPTLHEPSASGYGPLFSHGQPYSQGPPGEMSDATRYLCGAAYLDSKYAALVIREVLESRRAVIPTRGVDLGLIIRHCLRSRQLRFARDVSLAVALLASLSFSPLHTIALMIFITFLRVAQEARTKRKSAGMTLLVTAAAIVMAALAFAAWFAIVVIDHHDKGLPSPWPPAGGGLTIAVFVVLAAAILTGYYYARNITLKSLVQGSSPPRLGVLAPRLESRVAEVEAAHGGNLVLRDDGDSPDMVNARPPLWATGPTRGWSMAIDLRSTGDRVQRSRRESVDVDPVELHAVIRERLLKLAGPDLPSNEAVPMLAVDDYIVGKGRLRRSSPLIDPRGIPYSYASPEAVSALIRHPQADLRYYQRVSVQAEGQDVWAGPQRVIGHAGPGLEVSILVRAAVEGRMLYIAFLPTALPPIKDSYRAADQLPEIASARFPLRAIADAAFMAPRETLRAPIAALSTLWDMIVPGWLSRNDICTASSYTYCDAGARISVRELGAARSFTDSQILDVHKYAQMIERQVIDAVQAFLDAKGVDATEFQAGAQTVINNSILIRNIGTRSSRMDVENNVTQLGEGQATPA